MKQRHRKLAVGELVVILESPGRVWEPVYYPEERWTAIEEGRSRMVELEADGAFARDGGRVYTASVIGWDGSESSHTVEVSAYKLVDETVNLARCVSSSWSAKSREAVVRPGLEDESEEVDHGFVAPMTVEAMAGGSLGGVPDESVFGPLWKKRKRNDPIRLEELRLRQESHNRAALWRKVWRVGQRAGLPLVEPPPMAPSAVIVRCVGKRAWFSSGVIDRHHLRRSLSIRSLAKKSLRNWIMDSRPSYPLVGVLEIVTPGLPDVSFDIRGELSARVWIGKGRERKPK